MAWCLLLGAHQACKARSPVRQSDFSTYSGAVSVRTARVEVAARPAIFARVAVRRRLAARAARVEQADLPALGARARVGAGAWAANEVVARDVVRVKPPPHRFPCAVQRRD